MRSFLLVTLLVAGDVSVAQAAAPADAAPVVVVPFTGLHGDEPQSAIVKQLGSRAAVVPTTELNRLKPYVVVYGTVERQAHGLKLTVRVVNDETNAEVGRLEVPITGGRHLSNDQLKKLATDVDALVTQAMKAPPPPGQPPPAPVTPPPDQPAPQASDVESAPLTDQQLNAPPPKKTEGQIERAPRLPRVPRPSYYPYVVARVGALVTSRALSYAPTQLPTFHGGTAGGIHAEIELYPLAFLHAIKKGVFAGLGGYVNLDKPFWTTTQFDLTSSEYGTDEFRVEGGARWRFVVRKREPNLELTVYGGAGLHTFTIDRVTDPTTGVTNPSGPPDARYVYGVLGAEARATFWNGRLSPFVRLAYEYVPDAGPTENLDQYGLSDTHGLQLRGGLEAQVWKQLTVGASAFYEYLNFSFENNVATAKRAQGATDQYYGGIFTVGYAL